MKRILHISKYYYPFRGGTEQVARDCVNALREHFEQEVICFNESNRTYIDSVDSIKIIRVGCFTKISSQSLSLTYGRILRNEIQDYNPDIIVFHYPNPFVAYYLLKEIKQNIRLVLYWHLDIVKQRILKNFFVNQNFNLIRRADLIIATSPQYIDGSKYLASVREKCVVIPNCVNEDRLEINMKIENRAAEIRRNNQGKTICVAVGRHTRYKGFDLLIQAAHMLDDSFCFYLIGKGEETRRLKRVAGDDKKIWFLGLVNEDELKSYMLAADIFCFPSVTKNEAFGISLAEAMYYGKPAVTFTVPGSGVNYVCLNNENGIEVPSRDVGAYARALSVLSSDNNARERLGAAGRRRVLNYFTTKQYISHMNSIIADL